MSRTPRSWAKTVLLATGSGVGLLVGGLVLFAAASEIGPPAIAIAAVILATVYVGARGSIGRLFDDGEAEGSGEIEPASEEMRAALSDATAEVMEFDNRWGRVASPQSTIQTREDLGAG